MNKIKILLNTLVLLTIILIFSCEKDDLNPTNDPTFGKLEIVHGDNQSGYFSEFLPDSLIIKASSSNIHNKYLIKHEMIQGNGSIKRVYYNYGNDSFDIDSTGILKIKWRLGCDFNVQKARLFLYLESGKNEYGHTEYYPTPSDSLIISANGTKPKGWARSCGFDSVDIHFSKIISYDNNTLYLVNRDLYSSTDEGLNWYKVKGVPEWGNIVDAQFNSSGWMYILTISNGICYSKDLKNWEYINNGVHDYRFPETLLIEDSTLFAGFHYDGLYKTIDNGKLWEKLPVGGGGEYYEISRHPNGDLYLFDKWNDLYVSNDSGNSWGEVKIDYKYVSSIAYDLEIDNFGNMYIGANDAKISKITADTYEGEIHDFYEMNHYTQHVDDINIINNIVYFTVNGSPTPGVYSSQNWQRIELGFEGNVYNYFLKEDETFLLISDDGVYYHNE